MKALPDSNSPSWIGLPVTAESQLKSLMARRVLSNLALLQGAQQETDYAGSSSSGSGGESTGSDGVLRQQQTELSSAAALVQPWIAVLPSADQLPTVSNESLSSATSLPADRWLARELLRGRDVISLVRDDLLNIW